MPNSANLNKSFAYCDGASRGNPGKSGWGYLYFDSLNKVFVEAWGFEQHSTNNRMEILAAIGALQKAISLKPAELSIYTDSKFVINAVTSWIKSWKRRGWQKSDGTEPSNLDLWKRMDALLAEISFKMNWVHVAGHSNYMGNEHVDTLAVEAALEQKEGSREIAFDSYFMNDLVAENLKKFTPYYGVKYDGKLLKFETWEKCSAFVKGKSGVKFKKISKITDQIEFI